MIAMSSAAFKQLAKRLGIAAGSAASGVGWVITLIVCQGVAQRASDASRRLRVRSPKLYEKLRSSERLDLLFFL